MKKELKLKLLRHSKKKMYISGNCFGSYPAKLISSRLTNFLNETTCEISPWSFNLLSVVIVVGSYYHIFCCFDIRYFFVWHQIFFYLISDIFLFLKMTSFFIIIIIFLTYLIPNVYISEIIFSVPHHRAIHI